jgi:hypothetical protein
MYLEEMERRSFFFRKLREACDHKKDPNQLLQKFLDQQSQA